MADSFPRQYARTQRFTLGQPRDLTVSPDGTRVVFLRSSAGDDGANALWVTDLPNGEPRLVADPHELRAKRQVAKGVLTDAERALRERRRDGSTGITAYATDVACQVAAFELDGELYTAGLLSGHARRLPIEGPVFDPRPDPTARRLAYVRGRELRIGELDGTSRRLVGPEPGDPETVSWGSADFVAAEEMHRYRGYWWSPDGTRIAVCRVDESKVDEWTIADPASPATPARSIRYPAAGTDNPAVTLHLVDLDGHRVEVEWDRDFFPYLAQVEWSEQGLLLTCFSRDQQNSIAVRVDTSPGSVTHGMVEGEVIASDFDDAWVEHVPGLPRLLPDGRLLSHSDADGVRRLLVDDEPITPAHLQVRSVAGLVRPDGVDTDRIVVIANELDAPIETHVWSVPLPATDGAVPPTGSNAENAVTRLTHERGVHQASVGGRVVVIRRVRPDAPGVTVDVHDATATGIGAAHTSIDSLAETPMLSANVEFLRLGERELATAVLFPNGHDHESAPPSSLPVLLDPYGGPHAQRVVASNDAMLASQWFADHGFCVVVADGRGTPGRGAEWERAVLHDLATAPLDDQVDALRAAAERFPSIDLGRVAIRGWSFGGYLAALAVLRRPDVFHAAIAGAPVTEWRLYDTHYTERYLGDPAKRPEVYDANSLLPLAPALERPLLLVHGLADDNVVAAHTLQFSSALLAAGRPHEVLPLVGVTHMTPQEVVAEHLLLHQLDFLRRSLPG